MTPDPARVRDLRGRLDAIDPGGLKVGLSWRSRRVARTLQRVSKSIEILDWEPILTQPGVRFVNLQYDETDEDIALVRDRLGVTIHEVPGLDRRNDLDGMMALTAGLDLVITISNVSAHFAGAVGTECWVMARKAPFWYWRGQGETAAIYDSVRVVRQARSGEWAAVIGEVAAALKGRLAAARPTE